MAAKRLGKKPSWVTPRQLRVGDVASIEWRDAISMDRLSAEEIMDIEEPGITRCWGMVVRKTRRYLFIASEVGDPESDSMWVEALPCKLIDRCRVLDRTRP
jgi:hypothetical protein